MRRAAPRRNPNREDEMRAARSRFALILLSVLSMRFALPAGGQEPAASCADDPKTGSLVIRYTPDLNQENPAWPSKPEPVRFFCLLVLDSSQTMVEDTQSKSFKFKHPSDGFEVILEPGVPNVNLLGMCGGAVTGIVTVKRNGKTILDEKEFEAIDCFNRERFIKRIVFHAGSSKPEIFYGKYPE
jgi:hypothetical protein